MLYCLGSSVLYCLHKLSTISDTNTYFYWTCEYWGKVSVKNTNWLNCSRHRHIFFVNESSLLHILHKSKKTHLVNPSWGRLETTIIFESRHSPGCFEIMNIMFKGREMDSFPNLSFSFHIQQGMSPCKSFTKRNTAQHNKEQSTSAEILEHDFTMHLIKNSPKYPDVVFLIASLS